jgi:hypothetical protein
MGTSEVFPTPLACLSAALDYVRRGWSPLALCPADHFNTEAGHCADCSTPGERPLWPWNEYQRRRPSEQALRIYWNRNPLSNVGIALGPVSSLVCLVASGSGTAILERLDNRSLPDTLEFHSPVGDRRLLYSLPLGAVLAVPECSESQTASVYCLASGAQTVLPPSNHFAGGCLHLAAGSRSWRAFCGTGTKLAARLAARTEPTADGLSAHCSSS